MIITRSNESTFFASFNSPMVSAILGPRRVGKSTLVNDFAIKNPEKLFISLNMDDFVQRQKIERGELLRTIEQSALQNVGGAKKIWVLIDEAQKCQELFEQIKIIYDKYKDKNVIKFILTGSGLLHLHKLSAESLAGRIELHNLYPFTLRETCGLKFQTLSLPQASIFNLIFENSNNEDIESVINTLNPFKNLLETSLNSQLIWGGFPEALMKSNEVDRISYLSNYIQTYLEKDIRALETVTDLNLYRNLMLIIAQQTGSVRQDKRISDALGCKIDTLKKYRGFLQATFLYREIYPMIGSSLKRLVKSPKGYLLDNGLISFLTDVTDFNLLTQFGLIGARFENWFLNELQVALARTPHINNIYFWRTSTGSEVDFVVQKGSKIFPFEVTYSNKPISKKINNLKNFMLYENVSAGFYIYNGEYFYDHQNNIYFIPAWIIG